MKKRLLLVLFLIPISLMMMVNYTAKSPNNQHVKQICTRYCHNTTCPHFQQNFVKYEQTLPFATTFRNLYRNNIQVLKQNALGVNYQQMNVLIYVIGFPFITLLLAWGAFRKMK